MKKRIVAVILVLVFCVVLNSGAFARGSLMVVTKVQSGSSGALISSMTNETLYVSFEVQRQTSLGWALVCSGSNGPVYGTEVKSTSTKALKSGYYKIIVNGYGNTVTVNNLTEYYTLP